MTRGLSKGGSKDDAARKELEQTLDRLIGTGFSFNCFTYGDELKSFAEKWREEHGYDPRRKLKEQA